MNLQDVISQATPEGKAYKSSVIAAMDEAELIAWVGGNSLNMAKSYCIKRNGAGAALYALAINPIQEWHFVGKINL